MHAPRAHDHVGLVPGAYEAGGRYGLRQGVWWCRWMTLLDAVGLILGGIYACVYI